jgi:hypothetical protein
MGVPAWEWNCWDLRVREPWQKRPPEPKREKLREEPEEPSQGASKEETGQRES